MIASHDDVQRFFMSLTIAAASGEDLGEETVLQLGADVRAGVTALAVASGSSYREVAERMFAGGPADDEWPQVVAEFSLQGRGTPLIEARGDQFVGFHGGLVLVTNDGVFHLRNEKGDPVCGVEGQMVEREVSEHAAGQWCFGCVTGERPR